MRIISMHKATRSMEAGEPPSRAVMEGMGPLMGEMIQAGLFLGGEGLRPSSLGVRLNFTGGKRTITRGPLTGSNELTDRYLIVRVKSIDEAIEWATRFANVIDDCELDVRPVTEAWDLGMMPMPPGHDTTRFMIIQKSNRDAEAGVVRPREGLQQLTDDMTRANVLLSAERLQPSSRGARLNFSGGNYRITDGPFTESKELIAGFSIMQANSIGDAIGWASRFAALIGDIEIDIRPLYDGFH